ncbi:hypothetical protein BNJ_00053 [Kaumoebavirus]|uniref:hypothetical protein n=1 Tax=Kaumoebavirus TaxID=1859492 RepID=UPI0009C39F71|nr:hypothetical protein BNJ_00053 [Kaumoebavirus]ARA71896.1 hypothetical protein BNJ_00053 [Kaumoebavirus]
MYFAKFRPKGGEPHREFSVAKYSHSENTVFPYKTALEFLQIFPELFIAMIRQN